MRNRQAFIPLETPLPNRHKFLRLKPRRRKFLTGFTLMELLVYLGMTTIIVVVISKFMVDVSHNAARNRASLEVQSNARFVITRLTQNVRTATDLNPSGSTLSLNNGAIVYTLTGTTLTESINGVTTALTNDRVAVSALSFSDVGQGVNVDFTIDSARVSSPAVPSQQIVTTLIPRYYIYQ